MKRVTIRMKWENTVEVEVPDDFEVPANLTDMPADVLEQMDSLGAELVDWEEVRACN